MWTLTDDIDVHVALLGSGSEQLEGGGLACVEMPHRLPHELALLRRALVAENIFDVENIFDAKNIYLDNLGEEAAAEVSLCPVE